MKNVQMYIIYQQKYIVSLQYVYIYKVSATFIFEIKFVFLLQSFSDHHFSEKVIFRNHLGSPVFRPEQYYSLYRQEKFF